MTDIQNINTGLPTSIQDIAKEVLIGRDRLDAIRAALRAAKKLNKPTYSAMIAEGQEYADRILEYNLVLKQLFESIGKASGGDHGNQYVSGKSSTGGTFGKTSKEQVISDLGFSKKEAHRISQLTPEAVEKAKIIARENNDIPSRSLATKLARQKRPNSTALSI
jgi:hypothetical protein